MIAIVGVLSEAEAQARAMLADCPAWQAECGAVDADAAAERVYHQRLPAPENARHYAVAGELEHLRPYAEVYVHPKQGYECVEVAEATWVGAGAVIVELVRDVPVEYEDDPQGGDVDWQNRVGAIITELCGRSRTAGFLPIRRLVVVDIGRIDREAAVGKGDCQLAVLALEWSLA